MSGAASIIGKAAVKRLSGGRPGVIQALVAATIVGVGTGALTYRMLRSGSD
jgi:hypothetical protein